MSELTSNEVASIEGCAAGHTALFVNSFMGPERLTPCLWCERDELLAANLSQSNTIKLLQEASNRQALGEKELEAELKNFGRTWDLGYTWIGQDEPSLKRPEPPVDADREDMENVGRAFMETIQQNMPGYSWCQCPSEAIVDLINERDEARASPPSAGDLQELLREIAAHPNAQFNVAVVPFGSPTIRQVIEQRLSVTKEAPQAHSKSQQKRMEAQRAIENAVCGKCRQPYCMCGLSAETTECPRCGSDDKAKRNIGPAGPCPDEWHGVSEGGSNE